MLVNSYGGAGSKFLTAQLIDAGVPLVSKASHVHIRNPLAVSDDKVIFVLSNPIDSVISFFNRRFYKSSQHGFNPTNGPGTKDWAQRHCQNIQGDFIHLSSDWGIAEFVENGYDLFRLESFVENWLQHNLDNKVLFVKYDALWDHQKAIFDYLEFDSGNYKFSPKLPRTSYRSDLDLHILKSLNNIYGQFSKKIDSLDDIFLI